MSDEGKPGVSGVVGGPQTALFENLDDDAREFEETNPFRGVRRGGGSRRGVPNRRTAETRRYYDALGFRDPLAFLGHLITIDPDELARAMSMEKADALDIQRKAAADLMPYLHSKQPVKVDLPPGAGVPMLVMDAGDVAAVAVAVRSGAMSIDGDASVINQAVSEATPAASHGEASHAMAKGEA